jgi:hypothetical protein
MRMNYRKVELSDYQEISKKKTIINCEEMQYFQDEDELSEADDEEDEDDDEGEERKVGSASTGGGGKLASKNPKSGSTQLQTVKTNKGGTSNSIGEESKGEPVVAAEEQLPIVREVLSEDESQGRASLNRKVQMLNVHDIGQEMEVKI